MFGSGWLKRLGGAFDDDPQTQGSLAPAPAAAAAPADSGFRFQAEAAQAADPTVARSQGWRQHLALLGATIQDAGAGLAGRPGGNIDSLQSRWSALAKAKAAKDFMSNNIATLQKALAQIPDADRPQIEALIRNAGTVDDAMRILGDYQSAARDRQWKRDDVEWERNLPPEGMVQDPTTGKLKPRPGWPVKDMPGFVYDEKGTIVQQAGFAQTPYGQKAIAEVAKIRSETNANNAQAGYYSAQAAAKGGTDFKDENALRSQYLNQTADLQSITGTLGKVQALAKQAETSKNPGPADIGIVYAIMKMHDPGSTVREGEFATAENAGSVPQSVTVAYNKLLSGARLDPAIRREFVRVAGTLAQQAQLRRARLDEDYTALARRYNMDPRAIIVGAAPGAPPPPPPPGGGGAPPPARPAMPRGPSDEDIARALKSRGLN